MRAHMLGSLSAQSLVPLRLPNQSAPRASRLHAGAIEYLADVLATSEAEGATDDFYGRLCEAVTKLTSLRRAVIFRYDGARRRVRLAGAYGIDLREFEGMFVTVESAPMARRALEEDQVIEVSSDLGSALPAEYATRLELTNVVCAPMSARGRWIGAILGDRDHGAPRLDEAERELLWLMGKMAALATIARAATRQREKALALQARIDLAREVHEGVIQRLFGVSLALSGDSPLDEESRRRCAEEVQAALADLRVAVSRPLGRSAPRSTTTLLAEIERLQHAHPDLGIAVDGNALVGPPAELDALAQSVLAEAVRNAHKHAAPTRVVVGTQRRNGAFVLEVTNDGVRGRTPTSGMGLRLAAFEALQAGGLLEFGARGECWLVRLVVNCEPER
jgi:signal transduction histidine kinase